VDYRIPWTCSTTEEPGHRYAQRPEVGRVLRSDSADSEQGTLVSKRSLSISRDDVADFMILCLQAEFIKKYVPEDAHLYLIGHSIGAWFVLNLLKDNDIDKRVQKCYLLFPTIEYLAETRNGVFFNNFVGFYMSIVSMILILLIIIFLIIIFLFSDIICGTSFDFSVLDLHNNVSSDSTNVFDTYFRYVLWHPNQIRQGGSRNAGSESLA